jgi:CheY-like chemotaxis protein
MGKSPKGDYPNSLITRHTLTELKSRHRFRVLVAEDNHINQKVTASLLKKLGHRADVVGSGKETVEALKLVPYDIVLMDLEMPEMDGLKCVARFAGWSRKKAGTSSASRSPPTP